MTTAKLRIIIGGDYYHPHIGGIETFIASLAKALVEMGHEVAVVAPGPSAFKTGRETDDYAGCAVWRVRSYPLGVSAGLRFSLFPGRDIKSFLRQFKPDVIHVNNHFALGKALIAYGNRHRIPTVAVSHTMPEVFIWWALGRAGTHGGWYRFLKRRFWRWVFAAYNRADLVTGPTHFAIDELLKLGLRPPARVISNGVDVQSNRPATQPTSVLRQRLGLPERPTIVYLGRVSYEKRIDLIVSALPEVIKSVDAQLLVIGPGEARGPLAVLARRLGVADRVIVKGPIVDSGVKTEHLLSGDVFAIASPIESQSIVTMEAMACGKPVVAANAGALPELVHPGVNGELFTSGDSSDLAKGLVKVLSDRRLAERYGQASREAIQKHDIRVMPDNFIAAYEEAARLHHSSDPKSSNLKRGR